MKSTAPADAAQAAALGLTAGEWQRINAILDRPPNVTELGIFSAMWNEHCSYKSSCNLLRGLPTTGPRVVHGPGENAGVVDIGAGEVVVFKIESHNHPSYIEPYQGAATGVGGILRDVFAMGARPVAALNALRFGDPAHPRTRYLVAGVVAGIGGYGNSFGVPTVGGEIGFDSAYDGNCLVNAFAAGIARHDQVFTARPAGAGQAVVYVGARTGRDGVGGATMASSGFDAAQEAARPTVQVGDPFAEKRLCEACLELMAAGAVDAVQDMGAAGLTCASTEMGARGQVGVALDLDLVPCREPEMSAFEIMLSESQERMLLVLNPDKVDTARAILDKWDLDFAEIGKTVPGQRLSVRHQGEEAADLPIGALTDAAPALDRPWVKPAPPPAAEIGPVCDTASALCQLLATPELASRQWIWEQYDHMVMADTVQRPGGDAAVIRVHGSSRSLAFSLDCNPHYCQADPFEGGKQAVAEACRNVTATGATPLAVTDCLNFGNPEDPAIMGQLVHCVRGLGEACEALGVPVVSGNVSLYNETGGRAVLPTPVVGVVGLLEEQAQPLSIALGAPDLALLLVGETRGHLPQSVYARRLAACQDGPPPPVDLAAEAAAAGLIRMLARDGELAACHDLSDGGLALAAVEMALAGTCGAALDAPAPQMAAHGWFFGEDQARYLVAAAKDRVAGILARARSCSVPARQVGTSLAAPILRLPDCTLALAALRERRENWFPDYLG